MIKPCFICHGKCHHLSHSQVNKVKEKCTDRKGRLSWKCVERALNQPKAVCELCHGEGDLIYPYNRE